jgi:4-hydroxy-tetrahydrodipicolinate reductase
MQAIPLMINGLPGNVCQLLARRVAGDERFDLLPVSLTGPEITRSSVTVADREITLLHPDRREAAMPGLLSQYPPFISIDFTHPTAVNANADFYCRHRIPFVMGTTGGDREALVQTVQQSAIPAIIAPNMATPIVVFQAMMEYAAAAFPGSLKGYQATVRESHQQGKADTSGTAKAVVGCFADLGIDFTVDDIEMERDPGVQKQKLGVPDEHLAGHGWHTYTLTSPDSTVTLEFTHNVNGREAYVDGILEAARFLRTRTGDPGGAAGRVFSMIDVLEGGA